MKIRFLAAAAVLVVAGYSTGSASGNTVNWWTWDDKQAAA